MFEHSKDIRVIPKETVSCYIPLRTARIKENNNNDKQSGRQADKKRRTTGSRFSRIYNKETEGNTFTLCARLRTIHPNFLEHFWCVIYFGGGFSRFNDPRS